MGRLRRTALSALLLLFAAGLLRFPAECAAAARQGLAMCLETVLPALFPFFVLSSLCISCGVSDVLAQALEGWMRPLFGLSGAGAGALALGLLGGYPVGARTAAELARRGDLPRAEAERLLGFCNNAGPGFVLGVCGTAVFTSIRAGLYLYLIHVLAALLSGILLCRLHPVPKRYATQRRAPQARPPAASFPAAVSSSFTAVWGVCGFVVLFMVLLRLLTLLLPPGAAQLPWFPLLPGIIELTNGVLALHSDRTGFVLCAALLGWGGLSVHAQTLSVLGGQELSLRYYWRGKLLQALLSVPLALLISRRAFPV